MSGLGTSAIVQSPLTQKLDLDAGTVDALARHGITTVRDLAELNLDGAHQVAHDLSMDLAKFDGLVERAKAVLAG